MIDWELPIIAHGRDGSKFNVAIDRNYAEKEGGQFVKLPRNAWVGNSDGGTWHFNDNGIASSGITPEGYDGFFTLRNK